MKEKEIKSHFKKKSLSKLALSISFFLVLLTSTGYIFNSKAAIFLFYIFSFAFIYNLLINFLLEKFDIIMIKTLIKLKILKTLKIRTKKQKN